MTDLERLAKIKEIFCFAKERIKYPVCSLETEEIDFLIQQTEEKIKLQEQVEKSANFINQVELEKENELYKQALELIHKDTFCETEHEWVSPIHVIRKRAEKALAGG